MPGNERQSDHFAEWRTTQITAQRWLTIRRNIELDSNLQFSTKVFGCFAQTEPRRRGSFQSEPAAMAHRPEGFLPVFVARHLRCSKELSRNGSFAPKGNGFDTKVNERWACGDPLIS